ncbi:MAG TPA: DUF2147 domain-containing protein [Xanthobacteraceae bacterium]
MMRFAFVALVLAGLAGPALAADISGVWLTNTGDAHIRVAKCGADICGTIIWLRQPNDPAGHPLTDSRNHDPARRSHPLLGTVVAFGFHPSHDEPGKLVGTFYNADDGDTYRGSMMLQDADTLHVEGCLLMFCQTQIWTRLNR